MNQVAAAVMLLGSLGLVWRHQPAHMLAAYRLQAVALAAAAFWQAGARLAAAPAVVGLTVLLGAFALAPVLIRALARPSAAGPGLAATSGTVLAAALVVLAVMVVPPSLGRPTALAFAVLLLGGLVVAMHRAAAARLLGWLAAANGVLLAALALPGQTFTPTLCIGLLALAGVLGAAAARGAAAPGGNTR